MNKKTYGDHPSSVLTEDYERARESILGVVGRLNISTVEDLSAALIRVPSHVRTILNGDGNWMDGTDGKKGSYFIVRENEGVRFTLFEKNGMYIFQHVKLGENRERLEYSLTLPINRILSAKIKQPPTLRATASRSERGVLIIYDPEYSPGRKEVIIFFDIAKKIMKDLILFTNDTAKVPEWIRSI